MARLLGTPGLHGRQEEGAQGSCTSAPGGPLPVFPSHGALPSPVDCREDRQTGLGRAFLTEFYSLLCHSLGGSFPDAPVKITMSFVTLHITVLHKFYALLQPGKSDV